MAREEEKYLKFYVASQIKLCTELLICFWD